MQKKKLPIVKEKQPVQQTTTQTQAVTKNTSPSKGEKLLDPKNEQSERLELVVTSPGLVHVPADKAATLKGLQAVFQKKYGPSAIFQGSQLAPVSFRTTGIAALDEIIGGGLPVGRLVMLWGEDENGKLPLLYTMMSKYGPYVLYVDAEYAANTAMMSLYDVDPEIVIVHPRTLEECLDMAIEFVEKGMPFVVVDSVAALIPNKEKEEKDFSKQAGVSMTANLLSRKIYDLVAKVHNSGSIVVFTNQVRDKVGAMAFGEQSKMPGGHAIKSACSLVLRMAKVKYLKLEGKHGGYTYGQESALQVYQSKVGKPNQDTSVFLVYGRGFYDMFEIGTIRKEITATATLNGGNPSVDAVIVTEEER